MGGAGWSQLLAANGILSMMRLQILERPADVEESDAEDEYEYDDKYYYRVFRKKAGHKSDFVPRFFRYSFLRGN